MISGHPIESSLGRAPEPGRYAPPLLPQTRTPAGGHRHGTQKEAELTQLEQEIISSPWYAANGLKSPYGTRPIHCAALRRFSPSNSLWVSPAESYSLALTCTNMTMSPFPEVSELQFSLRPESACH